MRGFGTEGLLSELRRWKGGLMRRGPPHNSRPSPTVTLRRSACNELGSPLHRVNLGVSCVEVCVNMRPIAGAPLRMTATAAHDCGLNADIALVCAMQVAE